MCSLGLDNYLACFDLLSLLSLHLLLHTFASLLVSFSSGEDISQQNKFVAGRRVVK